jgi:hopanoid-associated phosphorylase
LGEKPVVVVTGMAFEARIATAPGVVTICGTADFITDALNAAIAQGCRGIASFGIAGGLSPEFLPGSCVVAREVIADDERFAVHARWSQHLLQTIPGAREGHFVGVNAPVATPHEKRALALRTGAVAVDMESGIAVKAASFHGLPFAAVRIVADPSDRALPPAARIPLSREGKPNIAAVLRSLMGQPGQLGALIRVGRDTGRARAALNEARRNIGDGFGFDKIQD